MECCILICDKLTFLEEEKSYVLGRSLNSLGIPALPHIQKFYIFIKIYNILPETQYKVRIEIEDEGGNIFTQSDNKYLHNRRERGHIPGVDTSVMINNPICRTGIYTAKLFVDDTLTAVCPLTIYLKD